jgi:hypothetical protein
MCVCRGLQSRIGFVPITLFGKEEESMNLTPKQMKAAMFTLFFILFAATSVITLLGVLDLIKVREGYLNALVASLLLELIAAMITLFKKTSFFGDEKTEAHIEEIEKRVRSLIDQVDSAKRRCLASPCSEALESAQCSLETISSDLKRVGGK